MPWWNKARQADPGFAASDDRASARSNKRELFAYIIGTISSLVGLVYAGVIGWHGIPQGPDSALAKMIGQLLLAVLIGAASFAFAIHLRLAAATDAMQTVSAESKNIVSALGSIEAWVRLRPFRRQFHHYHLTRDRQGREVWIYKILDFHGDQSAGQLEATAAVCPDSSGELQEHLYHFGASIKGQHLILTTERREDASDMGIEIFPYLGGPPRTLYSGRVNIAWDNKLVTTAAILSAKPLEYVPEQAIPGRPLNAVTGSKLMADWDDHSEISRLPQSINQGVTIEQKWNDDTVRQLLRDSATDATIRILSTFFVHDLGLMDLLSDLLIDSTRNVEILILDPREHNRQALGQRYSARLRNYLTLESALERIQGQLEDFQRCQQRLKRLAAEAPKETPIKVGKLSVLVYSSLPTLVMYQIGDRLLVGMLLTHTTFNAGPMITIEKGEALGEVILSHYSRVRENADLWPELPSTEAAAA